MDICYIYSQGERDKTNMVKWNNWEKVYEGDLGVLCTDYANF